MLYYLIAIATVLGLYCLRNYLKWKREVYDVIEKIDGPNALPIVGSDYVFLGVRRKDLFKSFLHHIDLYKPFFRTWNGYTPEIQIMKPEHLEIILTSSSHISKGSTYNFIKPWLGDGLLISSGSKWHRRRKMITPTFHFKILENFMEVFVEKSKDLVEHLNKKVGETFNIYPDITTCALDIICETAMGVEVDAMNNKHSNYLNAILEIGDLIIQRVLKPWLHSSIYYCFPEGKQFKSYVNTLHGFTEKVIKDRKKILNETPKESNKNQTIDDIAMNQKKRLSFLDLLLESTDSNKLSDRDIREEVDTFMFEGHDTTTAAMCWSIFLLANHPEIQEKVYEEVKSVLHERRTPETISDLNELKYLECCVKEALRLYPSVPFISRTLTEEITMNGYKIPIGTQCNLHIHMVHRDEEIYPEPEKFDPDRFLPENSSTRHPYAYIPFSAGPRNCIGQKFAMYEEKTILASIVRNFKIKPVDTIRTINVISELILRPKDGVRVILEKRND